MTVDVPNIKTASLILRQYYSFNLKERMTSMPYLSEIEKMWIAFQMVYSVSQIHKIGICHGDIKIENFLLTSAGSLLLR